VAGAGEALPKENRGFFSGLLQGGYIALKVEESPAWQQGRARGTWFRGVMSFARAEITTES
jgi:hypothetical protein